MKPTPDRSWSTQVPDRYRDVLRVARTAADAAAGVIRARWNTQLHIEFKGAVDLVSEVDREAEERIIKVIHDNYPDDLVIAEESGRRGETSRRVWHVDPLDGTTNYSHGLPHFCSSIGFLEDGVPTVGVIHDPIREWTFESVRGCGAYLNGDPLKVSDTTELGHALLGTGFPYDRRENVDNNGHRVVYMLRRCRGIRRAGAAALDLAYLAAGWLDGFWEDRLNSWDVAAGILLVEEAGGCITDFHGVGANIQSRHFVATNGKIHSQVLEALDAAPLIEA